MKEVMYGMTQSLLDQLKQQTVEVMLETGEAVGHSIDGKGRNYWDTYIEMLEKTPYWVACFLCLLGMLVLVISGHVTGGVFLVSQIINGIIRGRGKGLQRITESEFPLRG